MLTMTATFSPRSLTMNWFGSFMGISASRDYVSSSKRAIETPRDTEGSLFVVGGGGDFEDGEEGFLGDVDLAHSLHAFFAFFLFFEEFALAGNVAAVALGENVFADGGDGFAGYDAAADVSLDGHFEHLARNQFAQSRDQFAAAVVSKFAVNDQRQRVNGFAADQHVELDEVGF